MLYTYEHRHANMAVDSAGMFAKAISLEIMTMCPRTIVETGTFLGMGTTRAILTAVENASHRTPGYSPEFYSIECNPLHYIQAKDNLAGERVTLLLGLSVPRLLLPTAQEIERELSDLNFPCTVYVDAFVGGRGEFYSREVSHNGTDNLLGGVFQDCGGSPDFILLDSAGHLGWVEYNYVLSMLARPCTLALDDVNHVKHYRTKMALISDPRFTIVAEGDEKYGWLIARFKPATRYASLVP